MDEHDSWKKEKKRKKEREKRERERSWRNPERGCRSSLLTLRLYAIVNTLTVDVADESSAFHKRCHKEARRGTTVRKRERKKLEEGGWREGGMERTQEGLYCMLARNTVHV
jgi:hypothetical protein